MSRPIGQGSTVSTKSTVASLVSLVEPIPNLMGTPPGPTTSSGGAGGSGSSSSGVTPMASISESQTLTDQDNKKEAEKLFNKLIRTHSSVAAQEKILKAIEMKLKETRNAAFLSGFVRCLIAESGSWLAITEVFWEEELPPSGFLNVLYSLGYANASDSRMRQDSLELSRLLLQSGLTQLLCVSHPAGWGFEELRRLCQAILSATRNAHHGCDLFHRRGGEHHLAESIRCYYQNSDFELACIAELVREIIDLSLSKTTTTERFAEAGVLELIIRTALDRTLEASTSSNELAETFEGDASITFVNPALLIGSLPPGRDRLFHAALALLKQITPSHQAKNGFLVEGGFALSTQIIRLYPSECLPLALNLVRRSDLSLVRSRPQIAVYASRLFPYLLTLDDIKLVIRYVISAIENLPDRDRQHIPSQCVALCVKGFRGKRSSLFDLELAQLYIHLLFQCIRSTTTNIEQLAKGISYTQLQKAKDVILSLIGSSTPNSNTGDSSGGDGKDATQKSSSTFVKRNLSPYEKSTLVSLLCVVRTLTVKCLCLATIRIWLPLSPLVSEGIIDEPSYQLITGRPYLKEEAEREESQVGEVLGRLMQQATAVGSEEMIRRQEVQTQQLCSFGEILTVYTVESGLYAVELPEAIAWCGLMRRWKLLSVASPKRRGSTASGVPTSSGPTVPSSPKEGLTVAATNIPVPTTATSTITTVHVKGEGEHNPGSGFFILPSSFSPSVDATVVLPPLDIGGNAGKGTKDKARSIHVGGTGGANLPFRTIEESEKAARQAIMNAAQSASLALRVQWDELQLRADVVAQRIRFVGLIRSMRTAVGGHLPFGKILQF